MKIYTLPVLCLLLAGCATMPLITRDSPNYLEVGSVRGDLQGNSFYMAIGNVDLYRHRAFGGVALTGHTAQSPVALQVQASSGRVQQIVTLQEVAEQSATTSTTLNTVTTIVQNDRRYVLGDLLGGVSVIDVEPYSTWLDTLAALRKAADDLGSSGNFRVSTQTSVSTTVVSPPIIFRWFPRRWHHYRDYHDWHR